MADYRPDTWSFIGVNGSNIERIPPYFTLHTWMFDNRGMIERDVGTLRRAAAVDARPWAQPDQRGDGSASSSAVYSDRLNQRRGRQSARERWGKDPRARKGSAGR